MNSPPNYNSLYPDDLPFYEDGLPPELVVLPTPSTEFSVTLPFWLLFFGFFFPLFWVIGAMYILSPIKNEVLWGEVNLFVLVFTVLTGSAVVFGINYINSLP